MKKKKHETPEIVIPSGYSVEEMLDTDDSDFEDEQPILTEEVKLRFEREHDGQQDLQ